MKVSANLEYIELESDEEDRYDDPIIIESVRLTCNRCNHSVECFGTSEKSIKRCAALLREDCPHGENNFYTVREMAL
jgi:hypothetical protein